MLLWVALFVLVVAASFVLAIRSMRDFKKVPAFSGEEYGLFLIRKTEALSSEFLSSIHGDLIGKKLLISFERLIKGVKAALVVYGPRRILTLHQQSLDLLELEDYTNVNSSLIEGWEVGLRDIIRPPLPAVNSGDQLWWQLTLSADENKLFLPSVRLMVVSGDTQRRKKLLNLLSALSSQGFMKLTKGSHLLESYQKRIFKKSGQNLEPVDIIKLLSV